MDLWNAAAHVHVCFLMLTCVYFFVKAVFSWAAGGLLESAAVKKIPRIHSEKRLAFTLCWRGYPWHHSHSPSVSLTLLPCPSSSSYPPQGCACLCECVCVFENWDSFFHTCYGSHPKLCNLEALIPPHSHCLHFLCLRLPWLPLTEHCV